MIPKRKRALWEALATVAPGTQLREGLERIIKANMGALIVVGDGPEVLNICSGGFLLDASFSPQRLSELAKMDGAIILAADTTRIARANVHLVPNPNVPTTETGTRHRTAERVARSIGVPVVSVSEDMAVLTVYMHEERYQLEPISNILNRCNQALQTLERYRKRLDEAGASLTALEIEDAVTVRDVVLLLQRTEIVTRIADEVQHYLVELGSDGRLVRMQLGELLVGVEDERRHVLRDYFVEDATWNLDQAMQTLGELDTQALLEPEAVVSALHLASSSVEMDAPLVSRGLRLLARIPRIPEPLAEMTVERMGSLERLMRASREDLMQVEGMTEPLVEAIKAGLAQQAESSILTRYG